MKRVAEILACVLFVSLSAHADGFQMYKVTAEDKAFFEQVKKAVLAEDVDAFAKLLSYPLAVQQNGKTLNLEKAEDVKRNASALFTAEVKSVVRNQSPDELFKNWRGIKIGNGEIWFSQIEEEAAGRKKWVYRITGLNPGDHPATADKRK